MPRKSRKKISFTEDSMNELLQEIYEDSFNIRAKIIRLFNKWETKVTEAGEIAAIGESIIKLINAEAKNQDQKIMLLKYVKDVVLRGKDNAKNSENIEESDIGREEQNALLDMIEQYKNNNQ